MIKHQYLIKFHPELLLGHFIEKRKKERKKERKKKHDALMHAHTHTHTVMLCQYMN
jgi:hypothetical protein